MPTNDFLPFATDVAANLISQSAYAALPARGAGFSSGLAKSAEANKVWRQANTMSAMLGKYIQDFGPLDALDNGDIQTLENNFHMALVMGTTRKWVLSQDLTLYVNPTTGNDANDGKTTATAFRTIQTAINSLYWFYDLGGYNVVIKLAAGTYNYNVNGSTAAIFYGMPEGARPFGITIRGEPLAQETVVINATNSNCMHCAFGVSINIDGIRFQSSGSVWTPVLAQGASLTVHQNSWAKITNCTFATSGQLQIWVLRASVVTIEGNNNKFSGGGVWCCIAQETGLVYSQNTVITYVGNPTYTYNMAAQYVGMVWLEGVTFVGTVVGLRYIVSANGNIQTIGAGPNYIPGTIAGSASSGGNYF